MKPATICMLLLLGFRGVSSGADVTSFNMVFKGKTTTLAGEKFRFTATGTMSISNANGAIHFAGSTPALHFSGTGTIGTGKVAVATTTFDLGAGGKGVAVFIGKFRKNGTVFVGKCYAGAPARLGPEPDGYVYTDGRVKATAP